MPPRSRALDAFALLVALASLFGALWTSGLSEPEELEAAEFSRRIALFLSGDPRFGEPAADPVPTRGELGRGELPYLAMALGFRAFGLEPWAGRLPLALLGALGVTATYFVVRRLSSARAAALSALVLATSPVYFLHARVLSGEIATMTASAFALSGCALAVFDASARVRAAGAALGALGAFFGFYSRGLLLGVSPAPLAVGLCWLSLMLAGAEPSRSRRFAGALVLAFGALSAVAGALALSQTSAGVYSLWVGSATGGLGSQPTFETLIRELFHSMFPWSALLVPALALAAGRPSLSRPERALPRLLALSALSVAVVAQAALGGTLGPLPFVQPAAAAMLIGLSLDELDELDEGAKVSRLFAATIPVVAFLLLWDFHTLPDRLFTALAGARPALPEDEPVRGFVAFAAGGAVAATISAVLLFEPSGPVRVFRGAEYALRLRWARTLYGGRFWFVVVASAAAAFGLDVALSLGALSRPDSSLSILRAVTRAVWLGLAALCLAPAGALVVRDVARTATAPGPVLSGRAGLAWLGALRFGRGASAAVVLAAFALSASLEFYPKLRSSVEAEPVLAAYERRARGSEPLAVMGDGLAAVRYRSERVQMLREPAEAARFLREGAKGARNATPNTPNTPDTPPERRFLALPQKELAELNALFRAASSPRENLPILDISPSDVVLASNTLLPGERDWNPFKSYFSSSPPAPRHAISAELGGKLELAGWSIETFDQRPAHGLIAGETYDLVLYFRVLAALEQSWNVFVHLDGFQQRFNADHAPLDGRYPTTLWLPGDWVIDTFRLHVDASLMPATYAVYAGMYRGDVRMVVSRGAARDDRIFLGALRID